MFNMNNPNDFEAIGNMLLCDSDDYEEDIVLSESDTDEEEHVSEREGDSESKLSVASDSENEDNVTIDEKLGFRVICVFIQYQKH
jgi:hypothetical protein